ncbi:MAG: DUF1641 domain-containing protein [Candidatus Bipolaricaulota bacterium]
MSQVKDEELEMEELQEAIAQNPEAVAGFIERLDLTNQLLDVVSLGTRAMDDEMVVNLVGMVGRLGELLEPASNENTIAGLDKLLNAVAEASDPDNPPDKVGLMGLMKAVNDPDVQKALGFVIKLAKTLGKKLD